MIPISLSIRMMERGKVVRPNALDATETVGRD
jgi:hypothetical protein